MLTLYHGPGAICAQKVRVCLAEKGVEYESRVMFGPQTRTPEYLALNPGGYVPTLVHDGRVVPESRVINEYIDDAFDGPRLTPEEPYDRARMRLWTKQVDDSLHLNVYCISFVIKIRQFYDRMSPEERERMMPLDLTKAERTRDMMDKGLQSHYVAAAVRRFAKLAQDMERSLQQSPWLAGDSYSLADVDLTPYLQRLTDMGLAALWADKPALQAWWDRVRARPSFAQVKAAWSPPEELAEDEAMAVRAAEAFAPLLKAA